MKKILFLISLCLFSTFLFIDVSAASWKFEWNDTIVTIPLGKSINDYKDIPKARLYKNGVLLDDAKITYNQEGDWMFYLSDVNTSKAGEYEVWYKAYESSKYYPGTCPGYKCKVRFIVADVTSPTINVINSKVKLRRNSEYDLNSNIIVTDDNDITLNPVFTHSIDFSKIGLYDVKVFVADSVLNKAEASFQVEIYEEKPPTIIYLNQGNKLKIPLNGELDISNYFEAYDEIDGDLKKYINYPLIDNSELGIKTYEFSVTNMAGLSSSITLDVEIVDDQPPVLNILDNVVTLDYMTDISLYDFKKHIKILDNVDINYDYLEIEHSIVNTVGTYPVIYTYTDSKFVVSGMLEVKMLSFVKPQIVTTDVICYENEAIDLKEYITIIDDSDPNIFDSLIIYDSDVDYSTCGQYQAEAYVINSSGLSETVMFNVTVVEYDNNLSNEIDSNLSNKSSISKFEISMFDIILIFIGIGLTVTVCIMGVKIKKNKSI